jgi:hypothetical protein
LVLVGCGGGVQGVLDASPIDGPTDVDAAVVATTVVITAVTDTPGCTVPETTVFSLTHTTESADLDVDIDGRTVACRISIPGESVRQLYCNEPSGAANLETYATWTVAEEINGPSSALIQVRDEAVPCDVVYDVSAIQ